MAPVAQKKVNFSLQDFAGLNTQPVRQQIKDNEFYWLENIIPVGRGNLLAINAPSASLATISPDVAYHMDTYTIGSTSYMAMLCASGAAYQINLTSYTVTKFAVAGTFSASGARIAQWKNERVLIIDPAKGYWDWDGVTLTHDTATGAPGAGSDIATYAGRVWYCTGRTVGFSAPNSYTDFTGASFGGTFIITDATLHSNINRLFVANNFLYIIGDDSVNVVSDVRVSGASTIFTNTNISTGIGTNMPDSVASYYRSVAFANQSGIYIMQGSDPRKISSPLDGIFPNILFTQDVDVGTAMIKNQFCLCFLFLYQDGAVQRPIMAVFFDGKWFLASQGNTISSIKETTKSGVPHLYGTDGTLLYEMFANSSGDISQTLKTRLWDMGEPLVNKQTLKLGIETLSPVQIATISASVDTEAVSSNVSFSSVNTAAWQNNSLNTVSWVNNVSQTVLWSVAGYSWRRSDVSAVGKYIGVTLTSSTPSMVYSGIHLQYELRSEWG